MGYAVVLHRAHGHTHGLVLVLVIGVVVALGTARVAILLVPAILSGMLRKRN
jgi:hypothetical protein